ncbi:uncharacterized protein RAG0_13886 [Rhynchosporium agropyri]|uniref:Uncharacterized protein n=3 Tax=Rhynchosporium TaxID=38037 RepID=A0A1E1MG98_RHYSE|nr:uncharacterized protein RCO7_06751 [Rhynchosporium commune]CZT08978.1 uncharacterized protein RAG0_13886 [Rhynchosporium agropyri]CZT48126.1 uncharacterized protein RSE6_08785 [Rhynchosporium secalis]
MRFSTISVLTVAYLAATAFANPFDLETRRDKVCNKISTAQCCSVNDFGVANLECESPSKKPRNVKKFKKYCGKKGKVPACCAPSANGDGPVCTGP